LIPGGPAFAAKSLVEHRSPPLESTEAVFALTDVSEAVGFAAPEMPAAVRQKQLRRPAARVISSSLL